MAAMGDAIGKVLGLLFVPHESSWAYLQLLQQVIARRGVPASVYQDGHSALQRNDPHWTLDEDQAGRQDPTPVGAVHPYRRADAEEVETLPRRDGAANPAKDNCPTNFGFMVERGRA
jgi:hypothetical protein